MKSIALICALLGTILQVRAAEKLVGGPFVVHDGPRSATLVWIVGAGDATLGTEPGKAEKTAPVLRAERVAYTGLQPDTKYYYDLTAGFFGHDHNYQHYLKNGVHYVTTGGGGAPLYDVDKPPAPVVALQYE
jgi:hypothetical protein